MDILIKKKYVIVSNWAYPFGGGEEFLYTTMEWASKLNMEIYWICFCDAKNNIFEDFSITKHEHGTIIKLQGGLNKKVIHDWLFLLKPDIVHHQGAFRYIIYKVCKKLRIEFMSGFHFWTGAIILDSVHKNINILENYKAHKTDPDLVKIFAQPHCNLYCASSFVRNCIKKITDYDIPDIIYPSSSKKFNYIETEPYKNEYVVMINIHKHKGGEIFLQLIESCPDIPFLGIKTEYGSEDLDLLIENAIILRNNTNNVKCLLLDRVTNMKDIYCKARILLATSMVDETFCKVVNEAMLNCIPIITTGQGNIKYLVGNSAIIPDNWVNAVSKLYFDEELLIKMSEDTKKQYCLYSEDKAITLFNDYIINVVKKSKEMNIMLLTPWCDQGLGIQSKNYANIFKNSDYNIFVFAIKPYNGKTSIEMQHDPKEWDLENVIVYYSSNDREHISDLEIETFIKKYNIGKCLLPETCWFRVFELAQLFRINNVKCYAIPNIEIVRKDEIYKHRYFHKILCNNNLCKNIFNKYGINNTEYIGYACFVQGFEKSDVRACSILEPNRFEVCGIPFAPVQKYYETGVVHFLFIGGMNAFSRKHILEICESFIKVHDVYKNIRLTCTIQRTNQLELKDKDLIEQYSSNECITLIQKPLSYEEILNLYKETHISIQVSKHEGLGLGFYEALSMGVPIITLDTPPHNEIIMNDVNGWVIPCLYKKMTDNTDPLFDSAYFDTDVLKDKILDIINNMDNYNRICENLIQDYNTRLDTNSFKQRLFSAINN